MSLYLDATLRVGGSEEKVDEAYRGLYHTITYERKKTSLQWLIEHTEHIRALFA